ncbi:PqqD family peptide modification chaperone [Streptomyces tubbatahanensis]|uniref:PqqD family peptide modification chaperone n=1 Tax=Streptomyces tubbatahanensis TaxID=2923272 RepID=A0ABY3XRQ0_9ACTN|nr:PqqD family peptide modification chaperone [Streptomyces tubbatahanensis]UNS97086.1 PqqD family peptide modification chaperone [Streptomyces tubbatahanensis]
METLTRPKLREGLEVIRGMDDHPLLYDADSGIYHRLSRSAAGLVQRLDGSRSLEDIATLMTQRGTKTPEAARTELDRFVQNLYDSGLLDGSPTPQRAHHAGRRGKRSQMMPRFVVSRTMMPRLLEPVAAVLRKVSGSALAGVHLVGGVVGTLVAVWALFAGPSADPRLAHWTTLIAFVLFLIQIVLHETAHAMVAQILKVPVRGFGFALLFYFMPLAYVDRTDAYRLRERGSRVVLALAGPVNDGWVAGITALVAVTANGTVATVAATMLVFQVFSVITNLNPLLPSDGYAALEAGMGTVDARGRAFGLLKHVLLRRPLPSHLAAMTPAARRLHLAYGALCTLYVLVLAYAAVRGTAFSYSSIQGMWNQ